MNNANGNITPYGKEPKQQQQESYQEFKKMPVAIVLADQRLKEGLLDVFGDTETASLSVAGHTVVEHLLMELQEIGVKDCIVLASGNAASIYKSVNAVSKWGMSIEVYDFSITPEQALNEFKSLSEDSGLLVISADRLRGRCVEQFIEKSNACEYTLHEAFTNGQRLNMFYQKPSTSKIAMSPKPLLIDNIRVNNLCGTKAFHLANFEVLSGKYDGLNCAVKTKVPSDGFYHWSSSVDRGVNIINSQVMVGERCRVEKGVSLDNVVINNDVFVDRDIQLQNAVIMSDTIVSGRHNIRNALVVGDTVFQVA